MPSEVLLKSSASSEKAVAMESTSNGFETTWKHATTSNLPHNDSRKRNLAIKKFHPNTQKPRIWSSSVNPIRPFSGFLNCGRNMTIMGKRKTKTSRIWPACHWPKPWKGQIVETTWTVDSTEIAKPESHAMPKGTWLLRTSLLSPMRPFWAKTMPPGSQLHSRFEANLCAAKRRLGEKQLYDHVTYFFLQS